MHDYPFGHDQNGMDAFANHSIQEPYVTLSERPEPGETPKINYTLLDERKQFPLCQGWINGPSSQEDIINYSELILVHLCMCIDKKSHLSSIFNTSLDMTST